MICDAVEHIGQPSLRIYAIQLGGLDQRIRDSRSFAATFRADEQIILAAEGQFPFILPMSGKFLASIIGGMPTLARTSGYF